MVKPHAQSSDMGKGAPSRFAFRDSATGKPQRCCFTSRVKPRSPVSSALGFLWFVWPERGRREMEMVEGHKAGLALQVKQY